MIQKTTRFTLAVLYFICFGGVSSSHAQAVWPGDISNNGVVNGVDWLYWGVGYGKVGPQRPGATLNWTGQTMGAPWALNFPGPHNYAYADVDGNGIIELRDAAEGITGNFGRTHGVLSPDPYDIDTSNYAPGLVLEAMNNTAGAGSELLVRLHLGDANAALPEVYGLSFVLRYTPHTVLKRGISFELAENSWIDPLHNNLYTFIQNDSINGRAEITMVRSGQTNASGYGVLGELKFLLGNLGQVNLPGQLAMRIESAMVIDVNMQVMEVSVKGLTVALQGSNGGSGTTGPCPLIVDPVCGSNGVTYLNSCFAQAAGVFSYSSGVCFGDCIDYSQYNPNATCPAVYEPVCGCNGETYTNACKAESAGVTTYFSGPCPNSTCYDPQYVIASAGTSVNYNTGVITVSCPATYDPVCGCNGVTYTNSCLAEASGITFYTPGTCESACIDPQQMDPDAVCATIYQPVCGCNGETYANACQAEAAGITSYSNGVCGAASSWCTEAVPVQCGDFLANETTIGAGNQIMQYPACSSNSYWGSDRVYVLHKTSAGDLQIGLEIMTPNVDLDLFLLSDNCSQVTCLRSSTTPNTQSNNEGILLANAPIGVYYIVVDSKYANQQGAFRLEVSCGYLYCGNAVALSCGQPYQGTNINGNDDVSLYGCDGNVYNVENNGPEVVHTFTTTTAGPVTINMSGLSGNLELFLLRSCNRGDCIDFSQNSGNASESITAFLQPGTYYVVVDGYNGAVSPYTLTVNCSSSCSLALVSATASGSGCGASGGSITLTTSGGHPAYLVQYSGPISGSFTTSSNTTTISNLPPGTYVISKTDCLGCYVTATVVVPNTNGLSLALTPSAAVCMDMGSVHGVISNGGSGPFTIDIYGQNVNASQTITGNTFNINNLPAGTYTVVVYTGAGCSLTQTVTVAHSGGNFYFNATPSVPGCGQLGSIQVNTFYGTPPYTIIVSGPVSGSATSNANNFTINNLPGGTYTITIEDHNWCTYVRTVNIPTSQLNINVTPNNGVCGQNGSLQVQIAGSTGPYNISWTGPIAGNATSNSANYVIPNLPNGTYTVTVSNPAGCTAYKVATLSNSSGSLSANVVSVGGGCGATAALWIDIYNGTPPYTVVWTGAASGSTVTSQTGFDIGGLPCGNYTIVITDASGCSNTQTENISCAGGISLSAVPSPAVCEMNGSIGLYISGSTGPYTITWTGPSSGALTTSNNPISIPNLPAGVYTINVTNSQGCTASTTTTVTATSGNLLLGLVGQNGACGQLGRINVNISNGVGPYTIAWTGPSSGSITQVGTSYQIQNLVNGTYTVTVTDGNWCSVSNTATIQQSGNLNFTATPTPGVCGGGGSIYLQVTSGSPMYTITWTGPVTGGATTGSNNFTIQNLPCGTYVITMTNTAGCTATRTVTVSCSESTLDLVASLIYNECGQYNTIWVDIFGGTGPYTITWVGVQSGSATVNGQGFEIMDLPPDTFKVTVTDALGCMDMQFVIVYPSPVNHLTVTGVNGVCGALGTINMQMTGGTPPYNLSWSGPLNGSVVTSANTYTLANAPTGTYTVILTDANGCTETETVTILNQPNTINLVASLIYNECGQYNTIWVDIFGGTGPYTITWVGVQSGSATVNGQGFEIMDLPPDTFKVTVTDVYGCMDMEFVIVYPSPINILTATPVSGICGAPGSINLQMTGGTAPYTISWSGPLNGSTVTSANNYTLSNAPSGTYTIILTDANGCTETETVTIVNQQGNINLVAALIYNECGQYNTIWVDIFGGTAPYTVTWIGVQSGSATVNSMGFEIMDLPPDTFKIIVTDANGCMDMEFVIVYPSPINILTATGVNGLCGALGAINMQIAGGTAPYTLSWSGPLNGSTVTSANGYTLPNAPSGTYTIILTDANGCTETETVTIVNQPNTVNMVPSLIYNECGQYNTIWVDIFGGNGPFTVTWVGVQSGSMTVNSMGFEIMDLPPDTFKVTVTDALGCMDMEFVIVYPTPVNLFTATAINGACNSLGSINLQMTAGTAPYTISWTGPVNGNAVTSATNYNLPNLPNGTYTFLVTDANGCTETETVVLSGGGSNPQINFTAINGICSQPASIVVNLSGGQPPYVLAWGGPASGIVSVVGNSYTIPNLASGSYTLMVMDANGCTGQVMAAVSVSEEELQVNATSVNGGCGQSGSIQVSVVGGGGPFTINWTGPESGSTTINGNVYTITGLESGSYTISASNATGCIDGAAATVSNAESDLSVVHMPVIGGCGDLSSIWMDFYGGTPNYTISWSGPVSGSDQTSNPFYDINNLPTGLYTVTITDGNGCVDVQTINVVNIPDNLSIGLNVQNGSCGGLGRISVSILGGTGPYQISWTGGVSGSLTTTLNYYTITNFPAGTYTVVVVDANGCTEQATVTVVHTPNTLYFSTTIAPVGCNQQGAIGLVMSGGVAPFSVSWSGPSNGNATANASNYMISGLGSGSYTINVTDANGCTGTRTVIVGGGTQGTASSFFSYTATGLAATFSNLASAGNYTWNFGDGTTSTLTNPSHVYAAGGSYNVCLTVNSICGTANYCTNVVVQMPGNMALLDVGELTTSNGSIVNVPVTIQNCNNLVSLAGSVAALNTSLAQVIGVAPAAIHPQFNVSNRTFNYYDNTGVGVSLSQGQTLFYLRVQVTGSPGQFSGIQLTNSPLAIEVAGMVNGAPTVLPHTTLPGQVMIANAGSVSGEVGTYWGEAIPEADITVSTPTYEETGSTDANGRFMLPDLELGEMYTVRANKDNMPGNGLSTYALFIGQRFILGMNPSQISSPYQIIAGDANCNNAFTTLDLFLIQRLIIGAAQDFNQCPSWVFVADGQSMPTQFDAYNVFPYASSDSLMVMHDTTSNFVGVKVGDILGHANPTLFHEDDIEERTFNELVFKAPNQAVSEGETVTLYFDSNNFEDVVSYQFALNFNPEWLEFIEFTPAAASPFNTVVAGDAQVDAGELRLSWFSLDGQGHSAEAGTSLFALTFRARQDITNWAEALLINSAAMLPEAYNDQNIRLEPVLVFENTTATEVVGQQGFYLYQNTPNPFREQTLIRFDLPETMEATLSIRDGLGRTIREMTADYSEGTHQLDVRALQLAPGVYHYTLRAGRFTATRSMIVME